MTKAELIERIARSRELPPDISKKLIGQILAVAFDELASYFARGRVTRSQSPRFTFPRFGTFTKKRRSARRGINPRTLEPIQIEACNTLDFKASRELREAMNPRAGEAGELAEPTWLSRGPSRGGGASAGAAASEGGPASLLPKLALPGKKAKARAKVKAPRMREGAASRIVLVGPGKRRLTPRDDDPELEPLDSHRAPESPDPGIELPASPMQRVTGRRRSRSRGTG
jgi:nucleoid DNA-binding protein